MEKEWLPPNFSKSYIQINIKNLIKYINYKKLKPELLKIKDIAFRPCKEGDINSVRYFRADISYPGIVIKDMHNPYNKKYRMIDGRHRITKCKSMNLYDFHCYVLTKDKLDPFYF